MAWSPQEVETLVANFDLASGNDLKSLLPNRSVRGIIAKAYKMGLRKSKEVKVRNQSIGRRSSSKPCRGKPKEMPDKAILEALYKDHTQREIANKYNVSAGLVCKWFKILGIAARSKTEQRIHEYHVTEEHRKIISETHKGKTISDEQRRRIGNANSLKTLVGHKKKRADGYIAVFYPSHPDANADGYVMEHRLVMENALGRRLKKEEVVHHKNRNRSDNKIENLMLFPNGGEHRKYHANERKNVL